MNRLFNLLFRHRRERQPRLAVAAIDNLTDAILKLDGTITLAIIKLSSAPPPGPTEEAVQAQAQAVATQEARLTAALGQ